jgi:hypothetical protein
MNGMPVGRVGEIADRLVRIDDLHAELKKASAHGVVRTRGEQDQDIVIQADRAVRWAAVASVAATVAYAGYDSVIFVFAPRESMARPQSDLMPKAIDPSKKVPLSPSGGKNKVFAECPEAQAGMSQSIDPKAGLTRKQSLERLAKVLPPALRACKCRVNLEDLRAVLWGWHRGSDHAAYAVGVSLAKPGDQNATEITEAPDATWATAHKKILALSGSKDHVFKIANP